ncbi:MAG: hypothetical protein CMM07_08400, partial [Rhodopirellula sp.]|nr:hypothetical protein [Rhodopirellula sp.]
AGKAAVGEDQGTFEAVRADGWVGLVVDAVAAPGPFGVFFEGVAFAFVAGGFTGTDGALVVAPADGAFVVCRIRTAFGIGEVVAVVIERRAGGAFRDAVSTLLVVLAVFQALGWFLFELADGSLAGGEFEAGATEAAFTGALFVEEFVVVRAFLGTTINNSCIDPARIGGRRGAVRLDLFDDPTEFVLGVIFVVTLLELALYL